MNSEMITKIYEILSELNREARVVVEYRNPESIDVPSHGPFYVYAEGIKTPGFGDSFYEAALKVVENRMENLQHDIEVLSRKLSEASHAYGKLKELDSDAEQASNPSQSDEVG